MNQSSLYDWATKAASPSTDAEWIRFTLWIALVAGAAFLAMGLGHFPGWKVPLVVGGAVGAAAASTSWLGPIENVQSLGRVAAASVGATLVIALAVSLWNP